jgi:hypothetical protein
MRGNRTFGEDLAGIADPQHVYGWDAAELPACNAGAHLSDDGCRLRGTDEDACGQQIRE